STEFALIIVALPLLVAPYIAVYRGFFQGFGDMKPTAISQVIEQLVRVALILIVAYFLVAMDYSNDIVAGGIMAGSV
ncbi:oligosaccharide flippase family protein, partial [Bacillus velezensis]|uniref:oligosaccharide flippase family protein n=1 Tax=Bacillus velezensis TaxID=492670 RepID=UPI00201BF466